MSKQYYVKSTNEPVSMGSVFTIHQQHDNKYGKVDATITITLTSEIMDDLIESGIIYVKETPTMDDYYLNIISNLNWDPDTAPNIIGSLIDHYPAAMFNLYLKEIAIDMDRKYAEDISTVQELYFISMSDGKIHRMTIPPASYNNISLFRSVEDAQRALEILKPLHNRLYPYLYEEPKSEPKEEVQESMTCEDRKTFAKKPSRIIDSCGGPMSPEAMLFLTKLFDSIDV